MDSLATTIKQVELDIQSLAAALKLNEERYIKLGERYIDAIKTLRLLRAVDATKVEGGEDDGSV